MLLSFCTPCMNRFHHLEKTLAWNLESMARFDGEVEWVVVNYNSRDGMDEGMRRYAAHVAAGRLSYYRATGVRYFNVSHAKNLSHVLARGDYVMSLDADNFIDAGGVALVLRLFREHPDAVLKGPGGLVGLKRSRFLSLGGYDEDFRGWGYEENDFLSRARRARLRQLNVACMRSRIEHGDGERLENFDPAVLAEFAGRDPSGVRKAMDRANARLSLAKSLQGRIRANENRSFGRAAVTKNFSETAFEARWPPVRPTSSATARGEDERDHA